MLTGQLATTYIADHLPELTAATSTPAAQEPAAPDPGLSPGRVALRAPVHGAVVSVLVRAGDQVAPGQEVAVVEAMKMQHAVSSPVAGLIERVLVTARRGIRVNAVAPGYFRSEMTDAIPPDQLRDFIASTSTLGRVGEQCELDAAVVFLARPASSYIAGVTLAVDGGMSGH